MSADALLRTVVARLDAIGIPFMLTGSMAAAVHGAGRATFDVDLVIDASADQLRALVDSLASDDLYVSASAAQEALDRESMFSVVEVQTGWKADLIIRKSCAFSTVGLARRRPIEFEGIPIWVATLEDAIISKLEWARIGGSPRQIEDVANLLRVAADDIDRAYLDRWIERLGLHAQWKVAQPL